MKIFCGAIKCAQKMQFFAIFSQRWVKKKLIKNYKHDMSNKTTQKGVKI